MALRIGLISALKRTPQQELRAVQKLAGRSVVDWQVDIALEWGCERIICLCDTPPPEVIAQQRRTEDQGLSFHTARTHLQLGNLVRLQDDILVQLDGLIVGGPALNWIKADSRETLPRIFTIYASHPLIAGHQYDFERIDRDRHWAGISLIPGECASLINEMPADSDTISTLLRLGLQAQVECTAVGSDALDNDNWIIADDGEALSRRSEAIIQAGFSSANWGGPGSALASTIVRLSASKWLTRGSELFGALSLGTMLVAASIAASGSEIIGVCIASLGALFANVAKSACTLRSRIFAHIMPTRALRYLVPSICGLAALVLGLAHVEAANWPVRISLPLLALGLCHIASTRASGTFQAFWRDTPSHLAVFAFAAAFGFFQEALLVFALGALLQLMLLSQEQSASAEG